MIEMIFTTTKCMHERWELLISFCVEIIVSTCFSHEIHVPHQHIL
jgi:hypothetical protein